MTPKANILEILCLFIIFELFRNIWNIQYVFYLKLIKLILQFQILKMGNAFNRNKKTPSLVHPTKSSVSKDIVFQTRESKILKDQYQIDLLQKNKLEGRIRQIPEKLSLNNEESIVQNFTPIMMPEILSPSEQFLNILSSSKTKHMHNFQIKKVNDQSLKKWRNQEKQGEVYIDLQQSVDFNPAHNIFNIFIISIIQYMKTFDKSIIESSRFITIEQPGKRKRYTTKLFVNGQFLTVECISRQNNWIKLLESAVLSTFIRNLNFSEYSYYILGWTPMKCEPYTFQDSDELFSTLKDKFQRGCLIGALAISNSVHFSILQFGCSQQGDQYILGKMGVQCKEIWNYVDTPSKHLKQKINQQEHIYVLEWDTILKNKSTLMLSWRSELMPHKFEVNQSYQLNNNEGNFSSDDLYINVYHSDQYVLKIFPHEQDIEVGVLLNIHSESFSDKSDNFPKISMFAFQGNRIIYVKDQLAPNQQSVSGDLYSGAHTFSKSDVDQYYILVVLNLKQSYDYTLSAYSNSKIEVVKLPLQEREQVKIEGIFDEDNIGQSIFSPQFLNNPIYLINVASPTKLQFFLEVNQKSFKVMNILIQIDQQIAAQNLRSFISEYYNDFVQNYYSNGFYYPGVSCNTIKVKKPSIFIYIPLGYQSQMLTDYSIKISTDSKKAVEVVPARWKAYQNIISATGIYKCEFVHKHPSWQDVFQLSEDIINSNRVYYFMFKNSLNAIFKIVSLTYQRIYTMEDLSTIGQKYYHQPDFSLLICKVKRSDNRCLAKIFKKTNFSKCPSGLRTQSLRLEQDSDILFWIVIVVAEYYDTASETQYQLTINSNKKIYLHRLTMQNWKQQFRD